MVVGSTLASCFVRLQRVASFRFLLSAGPTRPPPKSFCSQLLVQAPDTQETSTHLPSPPSPVFLLIPRTLSRLAYFLSVLHNFSFCPLCATLLETATTLLLPPKSTTNTASNNTETGAHDQPESNARCVFEPAEFAPSQEGHTPQNHITGRVRTLILKVRRSL